MPVTKIKLWHYQLFFILAFTLLWLPRMDVGQTGFLSGWDQQLTGLKFKVRGKKTPSDQIAIVEIDSASIEALGRWPWNREYVALLIERVFRAGAKTVALDIVFSESQKDPASADPLLEKVLSQHGENITLPWITETICEKACPQTLSSNDSLVAEATPLPEEGISIKHFANPIQCLPRFTKNIKSQGFANAERDTDGGLRYATYYLQNQQGVFPSLPLASAALALNKTPNELIKKSGGPINHLGPEGTFPHISALQLLQSAEREIASENNRLTGKNVFIGLTALAVGDLVATPFSPSIPGVEVQATIAEQLLTGSLPVARPIWVLGLSLFFSGLLILFSGKLEKNRLFLLFPVLFAVVFFLDFFILFPKAEHWPTGLIYADMGFVFVSTFMGRYYEESERRRFLKTAFSRYVSKDVVDTLAANPESLQLGGERKEVSILFCDLRNFTSLSENLNPKDLSAFLNEYFTLLTGAIFKHQGTVDKYIGDALMAFFGAPLSQPDHAKKACEAGIEILKILEEKGPELRKKSGFDLHLGIGINSGLVSVGNMGSEQRMSYTVIGDNVNLASRLEGTTQHYQVPILTTHLTFECIYQQRGEPPPFRVLDLVRVKGKAEAVQLIEIGAKPWNDEGLKWFEDARELYRERQWKEAIAFFQNASDKLKRPNQSEDGPCRVFMERCQTFASKPPPADWDGTWDLRTK